MFGFVTVLAMIGMISVPTKAQATWTDPATGLMWAHQDNGSLVNWNQANSYCSNLRLGGYSDWRLPTLSELTNIYDGNLSAREKYVKGGIQLSYTGLQKVWTSSTGGISAGQAWNFSFRKGWGEFDSVDYAAFALCVRRP
jgi:hypothetical protein